MAHNEAMIKEYEAMNKEQLREKRLNSALELALGEAEVKGYKFGKVKISSKVINGSKVGYAGGSDKGSINGRRADRVQNDVFYTGNYR